MGEVASYKGVASQFLDLREAVEIGAQYVALQRQIQVFSVARDAEKAGRLQFLDVMGERGGRHIMRLKNC